MTQTPSPYQTPQSELDDASELTAEIVPVSKGIRFLNFIIDYILFRVFAAIVGVMAVILFGDAGIEFLESLPDIAIGIPLYLSYFLLFEGLSGRTPAKFMTGTKVINEQGEPPSFSQILGRTLCRFIPFEGFSFFGTPCRGWHDRFSRTFVVKCR